MRHAADHLELIGTSAVMADLAAEIERVARSTTKVLITGESGSGKEVVARAIHAASPRAAAAFVPVNCAGIPETLLESELFGHVKGSFTGAYRDKPGKLEMANGGTILLDEIGEMTLRMQGLLLRFLEGGEIQKVGADHVVSVADVRVIAATNRNLRELIAQGLFREDLFYRLNVLHLVVPPLRARREDIPALIDHFLRNFTARTGNGNGSGPGSGGGVGRSGNGEPSGLVGVERGADSAPPPHANGDPVARRISPEALTVLREYFWPGNVRQLENVIERLVVTGRHEVIGVDDLPPDLRAPSPLDTPVRKERRKTVADDLYKRLVEEQQSFWTTVYPLYMSREITRGNVRDLIRKGLEEARGNYKIVVRLFNMEAGDYKRFLNFLRKHECQLPFKEYR